MFFPHLNLYRDIVCNTEHANQPLLPTQVNKNMRELTTIRSKLSCPGGKLAPNVKHRWQFPLQAACRQPVEKVRGIQKSIKESDMD